MDSFAHLTCLVCYHEGTVETFVPKSPTPGSEYECPVCLNNDTEYIEETRGSEPVAV